MENEIIQTLSNVNINSDTAQVIMQEYMRYKYVKLAVTVSVFLPLVLSLSFIGYLIAKDEFEK